MDTLRWSVVEPHAKVAGAKMTADCKVAPETNNSFLLAMLPTAVALTRFSFRLSVALPMLPTASSLVVNKTVPVLVAATVVAPLSSWNELTVAVAVLLLATAMLRRLVAWLALA